MSVDFVFLASGSPRRRELLQQIGVPFQVLPATADETTRPGEVATDYVLRVAVAKGRAGWDRSTRNVPVLAADTAVVLDDRILGKPANAGDALRMLRLLSGRTHQVLTAVALLTANGAATRLCRSEVTFRAISAAEAAAYWQTGEPHDKAGGYAVQGKAALFISELRGSYSGVMGLPLFETAELLTAAGMPHWLSGGEQSL
jgi:septum formation protein